MGHDARAPDIPGHPVEVAWLDRSGRILGTNAAWDAFGAAQGADPATCGAGTSYLEVCDAAGDEVSQRVGEAVRRACSGSDEGSAPIAVPCAIDSGMLWFELSAHPRRADDGDVLGATVALRLVDAPVRPGEDDGLDPLSVWHLVDQGPDGLLVVDRAGAIAFANLAMERLTGHRHQDLMGSSLDRLVPDEVRDRHRDLHRSYWHEPRPRAMDGGLDLELLRRDGTTLPVEISLAPVRIGGAPMVVATIRDVSGRRREDQAQRRLLALLDLVPDAVYVVDAATTRIEYANTGAATILHRSRDELTAMTIYELSPDASDTRRRQVLEEHRRAGAGHLHQVHVRRRAGDGTLIPFDSRGQVVDTDGGGQKVVIVERDARERLAAERSRARHARLTGIVGEITAMVLSGAPPGAVHTTVVERTAELLDAENASLVLRRGPHHFETSAATGPAATLHLSGAAHLDPATLERWTASDEAFILDQPPAHMPEAIRSLVGPGLVARLHGTGRGVLTAFRARGREPFDADDLALARDLARQVSTALVLGKGRSAQQRLALIEDRQRIARDLHDLVVQDVISIGMQLGMSDALDGEERDVLLDRIEEVVRHLRAIVFDTRVPAVDGPPSTTLADTLAEAARSLGHAPTLVVEGSVDDLEPAVVEHLVPVLREALSNVARHARASTTSVVLRVSPEVVELVVDDDGVGPHRRDPAGTGLANLAERAFALEGTTAVSARPDGGTRLVWSARRPRPEGA